MSHQGINSVSDACGEQGNIGSHIPRKGICYNLNHEEPAPNFLGLSVHHSNIYINLYYTAQHSEDWHHIPADTFTEELRYCVASYKQWPSKYAARDKP